MAQTSTRQTPTINHREQKSSSVRDFYMPAMPPLGLSKTLRQWLRMDRRPRRAQPISGLNGYLLNDLGIDQTSKPRVNERQLTTIYSQPLGSVSMTIRQGAPAEFHALRSSNRRSGR